MRRQLRDLCPPGVSMAAFALRWILDQPGVSVVIPGARDPRQVHANAAAAQLAPLDAATLAGVRSRYDELIAPLVAQRW